MKRNVWLLTFMMLFLVSTGVSAFSTTNTVTFEVDVEPWAIIDIAEKVEFTVRNDMPIKESVTGTVQANFPLRLRVSTNLNSDDLEIKKWFYYEMIFDGNRVAGGPGTGTAWSKPPGAYALYLSTTVESRHVPKKAWYELTTGNYVGEFLLTVEAR